ncbi:MAG: hypothetical protein ACOC44_11655 [Promethearchaeia archaeon]
MKSKDNPRYSCHYCAIIRRRLLNDGANELNGDILAMGHNLTDIFSYKRFFFHTAIAREKDKFLRKYIV